MASCPMAGPARYRRSFKSIVRGVFKVHSSELGLDHVDFKRRVGELRSNARASRVDDEAQFLHVICQQYASAAGLESGDTWEKWPDMRDFYDSGALPRYVFGGPPRKKGKWNFDLAAGPAEREELYTTRRFLEANGLSAHDELHERMEAAVVMWARKQGRAEPPALPGHSRIFVEHAFEPADEKQMEALLPAVMKEQLRSDVSRRTRAPAHQPAHQPTHQPAHQPAHQRVAVYMGAGGGAGGSAGQRFVPSPEDLEQDLDPDEKVSWNMGVLQKMRVYETILDHKAQQQILANLNRSLTVEDCVSQIAMKCGALYLRKPQVFQPQPQMNEEKRRVYTRAMLPAMFKCANEVLETYVYRYK
jgi:hypothetical protein